MGQILNVGMSSSACGYARMSASGFALATSVMGVALFLINKQPYIAAVFGGSALSSCYTCYLAHEYGNLQDFATSNQMLRGQIEDVRAENEQYKASNDQLKASLKNFDDQRAAFDGQLATSERQIHVLTQEVETLCKNNEDLNHVSGQLKKENGDLNKVKQQLETQIQQLQQANTTLNEGLKTTEAAYNHQLMRLGALNNALEKMKDTDAATFKELIAFLSKEIGVFTEENQKIKQRKDEMSETAAHLRSLLERVNEWQNDATRAKLIGDLQSLHSLNTQIQKQVAAATAQAEVLKRENVKLEAFNRDLSTKLSDMQSKLATLGKETAHLGQIKVELGGLVEQLKTPERRS